MNSLFSDLFREFWRGILGAGREYLGKHLEYFQQSNEGNIEDNYTREKHTHKFARIPSNSIKLSIYRPGCKYAHDVTKQLGIDGLFDGAFDIVDANFTPKPHLDPYEKLIKKFDINPNQSILIEDIAHNLEQAKNLGMKTCWLENEETFAKKDSDKPYIDYKIKNLPSFLREINILKSN